MEIAKLKEKAIERYKTKGKSIFEDVNGCFPSNYTITGRGIRRIEYADGDWKKYIIVPAWQYHLQQAILEENPFKYFEI